MTHRELAYQKICFVKRTDLFRLIFQNVGSTKNSILTEAVLNVKRVRGGGGGGGGGGGQGIFLKHPSSDFFKGYPPPPTPLSHTRVTTISTEETTLQ